MGKEKSKKKDPPAEEEEPAAPLMQSHELEEARGLTDEQRMARLGTEVAAINEMEEGLPKPVIGMLCWRFCLIACVGLVLFLVFFFVLWWAKNNT
jgi:hypothetical protein